MGVESAITTSDGILQNQDRDISPHPFDSDISLWSYRAIRILIVCLCLPGIISNGINIAVFRSHGFHEGINISLVSLALADGTALALFAILSAMMTSSVPHLLGWVCAEFVYTSSWLAVFILFEKCLSIAIPFKVKDIVTPKVTMVAVVTIVLFNLCCLMPVLCSVFVGGENHDMLKFNSSSSSLPSSSLLSPLNSTNQTISQPDDTNLREKLENISYIITTVTQPASFVCLFIVTAILVTSLKRRMAWRKSISMTSPISQTKSSETREIKTAKMVVSISLIILICFLPWIVLGIVTLVNPEFNVNGRYHDIFEFGWACANVSYVVNANINTLVYYKMSTKYRHTFKKLLTSLRISCRGDNRDC